MSMDGWTVASPMVVVGAQATQLGENSTKFKHSYFFLPSLSCHCHPLISFLLP